MNYQILKERHRQEREHHHENLSLRLHRALSWLQRAEQCNDDDSRFIFLWIAFNAAYATEIDPTIRLSQQQTFQAFLGKLCDLDQSGAVEQLVWQEYPQAIRLLLDNPYVFAAFWEHHNGRLSEEAWKSQFEQAKGRANQALGQRNTQQVLSIVFSRLYTLRNQLVHGGATWNSRTNRNQLRDCVALMGKLVPQVLTLMLDHPNTLWGDPIYPVVSA